MQNQTFTFNVRELGGLEAAKRDRGGLTGDGADSEAAGKTTCFWADEVVGGKLSRRGGVVLSKVLSSALTPVLPCTKVFW